MTMISILRTLFLRQGQGCIEFWSTDPELSRDTNQHTNDSQPSLCAYRKMALAVAQLPRGTRIFVCRYIRNSASMSEKSPDANRFSGECDRTHGSQSR